MQKRHSGFTLMELMVTLAVAGIVLGMAVPNFRSFMLNSRLTSAANDFIVALHAARTEAVKRQLPVAMCATDDAGQAVPECSGGAYSQWVVWVDADNDWEPDNAANEPVLLRHMGVAQGVMVRVNADETGIVKFRPNGFAADAAAGQVPTSNVVICDSRGTAAISAGCGRSDCSHQPARSSSATGTTVAAARRKNGHVSASAEPTHSPAARPT